MSATLDYDDSLPYQELDRADELAVGGYAVDPQTCRSPYPLRHPGRAVGGHLRFGHHDGPLPYQELDRADELAVGGRPLDPETD